MRQCEAAAETAAEPPDEAAEEASDRAAQLWQRWCALSPAERSDYVIAAIAVGVLWGIATGRI